MNERQISRRNFLEFMAATAVSQAACTGPPGEKIVPYARAPEERLPGEPLYYATACSLGGYAIGVLVENNEGRPTKVEGNPAHPASLGGTDVFAQAALWEMWDPSRSRTVLQAERLSNFNAFAADMATQSEHWTSTRGEGLALLTGSVCSDSLAAQIHAMREKYPLMTWHCHDPLRSQSGAAAIVAYGRELDTVYHFDRARTLLCLDADFLYGSAAAVRQAHDFAQLRDPERGPMSRVYALESTPGLVGAAADTRLALSPQRIEQFVYHLAAAFGIGPGASGPSPVGDDLQRLIVADLGREPGTALVVPGEGLSASAHALVHALNYRLGADGTTRHHIAPVAAGSGGASLPIADLAARISGNGVRWLLVLGGNPAYDAPADLQFSDRLRQVPWSLHLGLSLNETSARCHWHVPQTHEFESWGDARAFEGTAAIVQPLIAPLYGGRSTQEVLALALGESAPNTYRIVREGWMRQHGGSPADFEQFWEQSLRAGVIEGTGGAPVRAVPSTAGIAEAPEPDDSLTAIFRPDAAARDGQFANNAWLQELPRPLSKLTWGNAAYVSPATAHAHHW